jgi:hypothetical protein
VLMFDSNSDFSQGLIRKDRTKFIESLERNKSGNYKKEFEEFSNRELEWYEEFETFAKSQVFGRKEPMDFSWKWFVENRQHFLGIAKAGKYEANYPSAYQLLYETFIRERRGNPKNWIKAGEDLQRLNLAKPQRHQFIDTTKNAYSLVDVIDKNTISELVNDLEWLQTSEIINKTTVSNLPDNLFRDERMNFFETELISDKHIRLILVTSILEHVFNSSKRLVENVRDAEVIGDKTEIKNAKSALKHTFIVLDEAHNFAPETTDDPYELVLGELIHRIGAEGRKYGLHLILATQRPGKLKTGLIGEFDNAIIMKMNSHEDLERLGNSMRILDTKLLEPCLHFQGKGNALAIGEMTGMAPYMRLFRAAPRRTFEGGVDIEEF